MAPAHPCSSFYSLKILAKNHFPIQQFSIHLEVWAVHTPSVDSKCLSLSRFQAIKNSKEAETSFRAVSVVSVQEQHKWGVDPISYMHSSRGGVICKQLFLIYSLTADFCHVCGGGWRTWTNVLRQCLVEQDSWDTSPLGSLCRKPLLSRANISHFGSDSNLVCRDSAQRKPFNGSWPF